MKNFEEFDKINEALPRGMWNDDNAKAVKSWVDKGPTEEYI